MTSIDKHVPGPWRAEKEGNFALISGAGWHTFARVVIRMDGAKAETPKGLANLELIRSAPEMLAAIRSIAELAVDYDRSGSDRLDEILQITAPWRPITGYVIENVDGDWWGGKDWVHLRSMAKVYPPEAVEIGLPIEGEWRPIHG